jgi:hypothetical protein
MKMADKKDVFRFSGEADESTANCCRMQRCETINAKIGLAQLGGKCRLVGIKMEKENQNVSGTDKQPDFSGNSAAGYLSEKKDRDWLPAIVLGFVIITFLVVFVRSLFQYLSDPIYQNNAPSPASEKLKTKPDQDELIKTQQKKLENYTIKAGQKIDEPVTEQSRPLSLYEPDTGKPANDLVAFYPFNGKAEDASGNGNHGTVYGATPAKDRFGKMHSAYRFDGVDDYVDIGRPLVTGDFTISFWLKSAGRQNRFAVPISQGNMSYKGFGFTFTKGRYNGFCWGTWKDRENLDSNWGKSTWHTLDFNFPTDINAGSTWHNLAVTQKGDTITVYRDGEIQGATSGFPINYGRFNFNIGRASGNRDFNHRTFNGIIDDIRIYDRALTVKEILGLYKNS